MPQNRVVLSHVKSEALYNFMMYKIFHIWSLKFLLLCQKAQAQTTATTTMLPMVANTAIHSQMVSLDTFPSSSASEGREQLTLRLDVDVCNDTLPLYGESMNASFTAGKGCQKRKQEDREVNACSACKDSFLSFLLKQNI